jgi:hypothetical protein
MALNPHLRWAWTYSRNGQPERAVRAQFWADAELAMLISQLPDAHADNSAGGKPWFLVSLNGL